MLVLTADRYFGSQHEQAARIDNSSVRWGVNHMQRLDEVKRERVFLLLFLICLALAMCLLLTQGVSASEIWSGEGEPGITANPWDMREFGQKIYKLYNIMKAVAAPLAVASIGVSAVGALFGSEKEQEKAFNRIKYTVIAIACLYLIPAFIGMGYDVVKDLQWDPTNPTVTW